MSEVKFNFHKNKTEIEKLSEGADDKKEENPATQVNSENNESNKNEAKNEAKKDNLNTNNDDKVSLASDHKESTKKQSYLIIGLIVAFLICLSLFTFFAYDSYDTQIILPNESVFSNNGTGGLSNNTDLEQNNQETENDYRFIVSLNDTFERVKVYKFLDLECPFCKDLDLELSSLKLKYEDVIDFEYVHLPLTQIHPNALRLANTYICLEEQNQHLVFRNAVYEKQDALSDEVIDNILSELVYDKEEFDTCLESDYLADEMTEDAQLVNEFGVGATPTIIVNGTLADNTVVSIENEINNALENAGIVTKEVSQKEYDELFAKLEIQKKLENNEKLSINEVATLDPDVPIVVITSQECVFCSEESTIKLLKENYFPNLKIEVLDANDRVAKSMIDVHEITSLPAFIFDETIERTYNFGQIAGVLNKKNFTYLLDPLTHKSSMVLGNILDQDFSYSKGNMDAEVVVHNYFSYECDHCAEFYQNVETAIFEDYSSRVKWVDSLYLSDKFVTSSILGAMTQCYQDLTDDFQAIHEELFLYNDDVLQLSKRANTKLMRNDTDAMIDLEENLLGLVKGLLKRNKVDSETFNACVSEKKEIDLNSFKKIHQRQGIRVVPTIIINGQLLEGAPDETGMRQLLDQFLDGSIYSGGVDFSR